MTPRASPGATVKAVTATQTQAYLDAELFVLLDGQLGEAVGEHLFLELASLLLKLLMLDRGSARPQLPLEDRGAFADLVDMLVDERLI